MLESSRWYLQCDARVHRLHAYIVPMRAACPCVQRSHVGKHDASGNETAVERGVGKKIIGGNRTRCDIIRSRKTGQFALGFDNAKTRVARALDELPKRGV